MSDVGDVNRAIQSRGFSGGADIRLLQETIALLRSENAQLMEMLYGGVDSSE